MSVGYFGIGIYAGKTPENIGGLWRSAHALGADFIFTVKARYPKRQSTDTSDAAGNIPLFEFEDWAGFQAILPNRSSLVGIEIEKDAAMLPEFIHPARAVYLLGAEDRGLPRDVKAECDYIVQIPTKLCLNVATAGSIVLYDRVAKRYVRK